MAPRIVKREAVEDVSPMPEILETPAVPIEKAEEKLHNFNRTEQRLLHRLHSTTKSPDLGKHILLSSHETLYLIWKLLVQ